MEQKKEINYLKAFSIILVVFYHAVLFSDIYWYDMFYICLCIALRNVHVPLFILLAGYLCHKQDVKQFYRKKARRILVPFLFMSVMKLLFNNLVSAEFRHANSFGAQLFDAFVCGNLYWFCYCLLVMFLLAPLFWNSKARIWVLLALTAGVDIFLRMQEITLTDILQIHQVLMMFPYFLIGMLLAKYDAPRLFKTGKQSWMGLGAAVLTAVICGWFRFYKDINNSYYIDLLLGLALMYLLFFAAVRIRGKIPAKVFAILGKYSFQIMLLDGFFRLVIYKLLTLLLPEGILVILLTTALVLLLACLSCFVLKRIPVLSRLTGLQDMI